MKLAASLLTFCYWLLAFVFVVALYIVLLSVIAVFMPILK